MLGSAADIIGPLISGNFLLQAAAQAGGENEDERDEEGDGGGDDDGEEEEDVDCSQAEQAEDAPSSQLTPGEGEQKKKKKRKRSLPAGSNAEAHDLMNKVMILWVGDPIGPNMGEAPTNTRRNHLAAEAMRIFNISAYKAKVQAFREGKDAQLEERLRACANTADKVRIVLL